MLRTNGPEPTRSAPPTITTAVSLRSSELTCGSPEQVLASCARGDAVHGLSTPLG